MYYVRIWEIGPLGRRNSTCKGPEVGDSWASKKPRGCRSCEAERERQMVGGGRVGRWVDVCQKLQGTRR